MIVSVVDSGQQPFDHQCFPGAWQGIAQRRRGGRSDAAVAVLQGR